MISDKLKALRRAKGMTLLELAEAIGTSKQTIHRYENGTITNIPPEKIELIAEALGTSPADLMGWEDDSAAYVKAGILPIEVKKLPILGAIACGEPIYADEEHESYAAIDSSLDADFCLRAKGDSMTGARIFDGDIVFIRAQGRVDNGQRAADMSDAEATPQWAYYYPEDEKLILSPENTKYAPLVFIKEELNSIKIIGKAVAFQSTII